MRALLLIAFFSSLAHARKTQTQAEWVFYTTQPEVVACYKECEANPSSHTSNDCGPCSAVQICTWGCHHEMVDAMMSRYDGLSTQDASMKEAARLSASASATSAAVAVVNIADGMNSLDNDVSRAGVLIEVGQGAIKTAAELKKAEVAGDKNAEKMAGSIGSESTHNNSLSADQKILASAEAEKILQALEAKYAVKRDDFISKTLTSGGSRESLAEIFGNGVEAKLAKAFSASSEMSDEEKKKIAQTSDAAKIATGASEFEIHPGNLRRKTPSLRTTLKAKLAAQEENSEEHSHTTSAKRKKTPPPDAPPMFENLTAADESELPGMGNPANKELSLFDVVHRKYQECASWLNSEKARFVPQQ